MLLCAIMFSLGRNLCRNSAASILVPCCGSLQPPQLCSSKGPKRCRVTQIRSNRSIAKIPLPTERDVGLPLRPVVLERRLPLHLLLVEISEAVVREREQECDHIVDLRFTETEPLHPAVEIGIWNAALVVVIHDVPKGGEGSVMHIGRGDSDIAQGFTLESADISWVLGDQEAAQLRILRPQRQLIDLLPVADLQNCERLARELRKVLLVRGNADIMKLLI